MRWEYGSDTAVDESSDLDWDVFVLLDHDPVSDVNGREKALVILRPLVSKNRGRDNEQETITPRLISMRADVPIQAEL
jgi:hypothetical protein